MVAKRLRAPWKVALYVALGVIVVGFAIAFAVIPLDYKSDARFERFGEGMGRLVPIAFTAAYLVQYRRVSRAKAADPTPRTDATGEPILAESRGRRVGTTSGLLGGRLVLTPRRIVFFAGTVRELDLELASITTTARSRFRLTGRVLDVTLADGATHRLIIDRYDRFTAQLGPALARARAAAAPT